MELTMFSTFSNNKNYILLLKADEFLRDRSIVAAARDFDGMICGMSKVPALERIRHFDEILCGDPHRPDSALMAVKEFEIRTGLIPKAVIPITEMTLSSAALIAQEYGLPFLNSETVVASRNKAIMKKCFIDSNVPTAKSISFSTFEELTTASEQLGFPVIVKPVEAAHSVGVRKISSLEELKDGFEYCVNGLKSISDQWGIEDYLFLVEEYIDSVQEISVEIINLKNEHHIVAITDKFLTEPPFFAEIGHSVPSVHSGDQAIRDAAVAACHSLGLSYGVSHVEIRINKLGSPFVIEVASRPGGDGIMDLVERAYGINMYDLHIRSYLGTLDLNVLSNISFLGAAAIAFLPTRKGVVNKIVVPTKLPREVVGLYLNAKIGDLVGHSMNYDDRLGTVEFFWRGAMNTKPLHLTIAKELSESIYVIN